MIATVRLVRFRLTPFPAHTVPVHGSHGPQVIVLLFYLYVFVFVINIYIYILLLYIIYILKTIYIYIYYKKEVKICIYIYIYIYIHIYGSILSSTENWQAFFQFSTCTLLLVKNWKNWTVVYHFFLNHGTLEKNW